MFSDASLISRGATPSGSTDGDSPNAVVMTSNTAPSKAGATAVNAVEVANTPAATPLHQPVEVSQTVSVQKLVPLVDDQSSTTDLHSLPSSPESLTPSQMSDSTALFPPYVNPPKSVGFIESDGNLVHAPVVQPPMVIPSPFLGSQTVTSHQVAAPLVSEVSHLPPPDLDFPPVFTPNPVVVPAVHKYPLVTPSKITPNIAPSQVASSPMTPEIPSITSSLGPSQEVSRQVQDSAAVRESSKVSQVLHVPQPIGLQTPSNLLEGDTSGGLRTASATRGVYKIRDNTGSTVDTRSRRDSIEGAPEIILTLSDSGYEHVTTFEQSDASTALPPTAPASTVPPPASLFTTHAAESVILPSLLAISTEFDTGLSTTSSAATNTLPPQQSSEESSILAKKVDLSVFAPRTIPDYRIDRSDFPSWLHERGRLDAVLSVESGGLWEKLITAWLRQERRLAFGLDENIVSGGLRIPL